MSLGIGDILAGTAAENHVWICGPAAAGVCIGVDGYSYHRGSQELFLLKSLDCAQPSCSFWPWESWICSSFDTAVRKLTPIFKGKLAAGTWERWSYPLL